jgi:UDP-N-acetylmuramoyl-tripeptide--D-alanyl-D-alanine ligase
VAAATLATASLSKWRMELRDLADGATLLNDSFVLSPPGPRDQGDNCDSKSLYQRR